jgi:hypothetical protein
MSQYSEERQRHQRDWCYLVSQAVGDLERNIGTANDDWFAYRLRTRFGHLMGNFSLEDN